MRRADEQTAASVLRCTAGASRVRGCASPALLESLSLRLRNLVGNSMLMLVQGLGGCMQEGIGGNEGPSKLH